MTSTSKTAILQELQKAKNLLSSAQRELRRTGGDNAALAAAKVATDRATNAMQMLQHRCDLARGI